MFGIFEYFNNKIKRLYPKNIKNSKKYLASKSSVSREEFVSTLFAEADILALKNQKYWHISKIAFFVMAGFVSVSFIAYTNFKTPFFLVSYLAFYAVSYFPLKFIQKEFHKLYIYYRSLAEGLRVELFLRLSGIHEDAADHYLRKHAKNLQWVREAMRSANVFDPQPGPDLPAVHEEWILGQREYFNQSSSRDKSNLYMLQITGHILLGLGIMSTIFAIFLSILHIPISLWVIISMIILMPIFGGFMDTYIRHMALKENVNEYSRMKEIFEISEEKWDSADNEKIIKELAREALRENADWFLLHSKFQDEIPWITKIHRLIFLKTINRIKRVRKNKKLAYPK